MTRKDRERLFQRVREAADRLYPEPASMSASEIADVLRSADCDTEELRQRLYQSVKNLQIAQRLKGNKVPAYLNDAVDALSPSQLGAQNPEVATGKAAKWLERFIQDVTKPPAEGFAIVAAYRKTGPLTPRDSALLAELEQKLKSMSRKR